MKLQEHQSSQITKMLLLGDSGAGKTGATASLAKSGLRLHIIDTDNGVSIIKSILAGDQAALDRVDFETITDKYGLRGGKLLPVKATAWQRIAEALNKVNVLGPGDVVVIDSFTTVCNAAMDFVLAMNARLGQRPQQGDWYEAQQLAESMLKLLFDESVKCNVVITCHIDYVEIEGAGITKGVPKALGNKLGPRVGMYFNDMIMVKTSGAKHKIITTSQGGVELKSSAPLRVKAEYPIETGLADYFKDVKSGSETLQKVAAQ